MAGPSGAGKDTLISEALGEVQDVYFSVSATTRSPRQGESDGRDYHFLSDGEFEDLLEKDAFLEWEEVFGERYGTLKSEIEKAHAQGKDVLLELDVKGALQVRRKVPGAKLIFVMPPSFEELESRLRKREKNEEGDISRRIEVAPWEMEVGRRDFDFIIVNREVHSAAAELAEILRGETD